MPKVSSQPSSRGRRQRPQSTPRRARGSAVWFAGLIVASVAAVYANSVSVPFTFDDGPAIERNQTIRSFRTAFLTPPPRETAVAARPVVNISLAANYALGGLDVFGYHVWNIAVHALGALVLFGIVRRTLTGP